jgi:hypothetical protein
MRIGTPDFSNEANASASAMPQSTSPFSAITALRRSNCVVSFLLIAKPAGSVTSSSLHASSCGLSIGTRSAVGSGAFCAIFSIMLPP